MNNCSRYSEDTIDLRHACVSFFLLTSKSLALVWNFFEFAKVVLYNFVTFDYVLTSDECVCNR